MLGAGSRDVMGFRSLGFRASQGTPKQIRKFAGEDAAPNLGEDVDSSTDKFRVEGA